MNIFLTGGSGVLGTELQRHLSCMAPSSKELDITSVWKVDKIAEELKGKIDVVIHSAAYTDVPKAEVEKDKVRLVNLLGTENIACSFAYCRIVYISTDYVYDGISGNYKETDKDPPYEFFSYKQPEVEKQFLNYYAYSKWRGEEFFDLDKDLIIRTSFKPNVPWAYEKAFDDLYTSADYVDIIAPKIASLAKSNLTGIINVGTERKSIYELAKRRNPNVKPMSKNEITSVKLPNDISMNLDKLNNIKLEEI